MKVLQLQYTVRLFQVRGIPGILIYRNVNVYIETYINIICELDFNFCFSKTSKLKLLNLENTRTTDYYNIIKIKIKIYYQNNTT